jgi:hypothetical protein
MAGNHDEVRRLLRNGYPAVKAARNFSRRSRGISAG